MKNLFLLTLIIPTLSACGIVGAAVDIITLPVDLLVEGDTEKTPNDNAMAYAPE